MLTGANYRLEKVSGLYVPGQYPGEKIEKWILPEDIRTDYARLNSMIETKYSREYLKICAFYNKMFPSLRSSGYITSSYNVPMFTALDQERADTGTGIASNYLKQIVDQIVSRIGTVLFEPALLSDVPTLEYIIYKDEVERLLRKMVRDKRLNRMVMDIFHDAAIVGYAHVFMDPVTMMPVKANDYEIGMFESQFTNDNVKQMLYRNYCFPVVSLVPYLADCDDEIKQTIVEDTNGRDHCDFKMYFDCPGQRCVVTINGKTLPDFPYPFDVVQMVTFGWDIGFSKVTSTSLFDLLYPTQREMNKVNAKIQQLIRMYKGAVPVFNNDVDLAMKSITNGTGEALYVDSSRPIDSLMTVINPTPLDAQLVATKTELKTEMYELAGIQQLSFDMENMKSAAAVIAVDQTRDTVFQAQLSGIAAFVADLFKMIVHFNALMRDDDVASVKWSDIDIMLETARVELKPVSVTNPLGHKASSPEEPEPDYNQIQLSRAVVAVLKGNLEYEAIPYMIDKAQMRSIMATTIVRLNALNIDIPDSAHKFMISAFIEDVQAGLVQI